MVLKIRIYEAVKLNTYYLSFSEAIDLALVPCTYVLTIYWFMVFIFPTDIIKMPVKSEDDFQKYIELADKTRIFTDAA